MDSGDAGERSAFGTGGGTPTVMCPRGHINNWDYKFCAQCGAPIGVVAWPAEEPPAEQRSDGSRPWLLFGGLGLVLVAMIGGLIGYLISRPGDGAQHAAPQLGTVRATTPTTTFAPAACPSPPDVQAESLDTTPNGLRIKAAFTSPCGDYIETNSALVLTVADGSHDVAAGSFDFSTDPLAMSRGGPAHRTLIFPAGMYWRTTDMIASAPTLVATRKGQSDSSVHEATAADSSTMTATKTAQPAHGSVDHVSEEVLQELRDADLPAVRDMLHTWVPQISSKRVGLVANGKTWSNVDILQDHLQLRQRYRGARLVWSGHWTSFSAPDMWVTIVGKPYEDPAEANSWCDSQGIAADDCFAKFISPVVGPEGTTVYRK
jgi:hypothetical protein